ncbi:MAG: DUF3089 domain-containing protein [Pseudomonadota bacterium]
MKKFLIILGGAVALVLTIGYLFRMEIAIFAMSTQIAPEHNFGEQAPPPAPDYGDDANWAALPDKEDPSDQMPAGTERSPTGVAVFFVHPTSYFGKTWNQPLDHADANWVVDQRILRHQASVFNGCCDVYAPRYRQATFFSFLDQGDNGAQALAVAYQDVTAAFDVFLTRLEPQQPFVIAGHSQGTKHATQLVREKITNTPLQERMVAAYLIGFSVTYSQLGSLPACDSSTQTGCAIGWNAMEGESGGSFAQNEKLLCTNPLSWRDGGGLAEHALNAGAIGYPTYGLADEGEDVTAMDLEVAIADAKCVADGQLAVTDLRSESFPQRMMANSMHVYDYSLYHMNLRQNVADRVSAFLSQQ